MFCFGVENTERNKIAGWFQAFIDDGGVHLI